jgi:hypothetical protein
MSIPENQSVIRKARGYFRLFCDITGKVFDMLDGPAMELQNRVQTKISDIRDQLKPNIPRIKGGKRRLKTQKKRRRS